MINSIRYFEEECIPKFEELEDEFLKNPTLLAEYVLGLTEQLHHLGLRMIQESLESMDQMLNQSPIRRKSWLVESHSKKQLLTSLGTVHFTKTLFTNKETGESEYLLDRIVGLSKHERMTEDAEANMLEEAVQTSYRRGGEESSLEADVSKQTVKNKLHHLAFPKEGEQAPASTTGQTASGAGQGREKKAVEYLYIDADEDHVALQFRQKKGDLASNGKGQKNNCLITKLVYVYEGVVPESPKSKRHRLVNPYYFCRVCSGEDNRKLWDEVYEYMDRHYDLSKVRKIYVNGDGGSWILSGLKHLSGLVHVLDGFHLEKYLTKLTSHMLDSREDAKEELRRAIRGEGKAEFNRKVEELKGYMGTETGRKRMEEAKEYLLSNWTAAKVRLRHQEGVTGCSAEGHVSHVLSARMSTRPMGWSETGAAKMAQLRAYYLNGGDMLELVRYQKRELPRAAGGEGDIISAEAILRSEKNRHGELGKYMEAMTHHVSLEAKKKAYFNSHIWGL